MIRVVAVALIAVAAWAMLRATISFLRRQDVDWQGVAFVIGFVMLAFWLHGATGFGFLYS